MNQVQQRLQQLASVSHSPTSFFPTEFHVTSKPKQTIFDSCIQSSSQGVYANDQSTDANPYSERQVSERSGSNRSKRTRMKNVANMHKVMLPKSSSSILLQPSLKQASLLKDMLSHEAHSNKMQKQYEKTIRALHHINRPSSACSL